MGLIAVHCITTPLQPPMDQVEQQMGQNMGQEFWSPGGLSDLSAQLRIVPGQSITMQQTVPYYKDTKIGICQTTPGL